jgi:hypothetical protein
MPRKGAFAGTHQNGDDADLNAFVEFFVPSREAQTQAVFDVNLAHVAPRALRPLRSAIYGDSRPVRQKLPAIPSENRIPLA